MKEDPLRRGLLFCGTERLVFVSFDEGDNWQSLQMNLPASSMRDLQIKDDDLVVATHGRGFWVLDDITALRQIDGTAAAADAILFRPAEAFKLPEPSEQGTPLPKDEPSAENPPAGAVIDYYLKAAPAGAVALEILDGSGAVLRRYASDDKPQPRNPDALAVQVVWAPQAEPLPASAGMHRWVWDLRGTPPAGGGRGRGAGGGGRGAGAAIAEPGRYSVRLTVDGKTFTQPLIVHQDPRGTFAGRREH